MKGDIVYIVTELDEDSTHAGSYVFAELKGVREWVADVFEYMGCPPEELADELLDFDISMNGGHYENGTLEVKRTRVR